MSHERILLTLVSYFAQLVLSIRLTHAMEGCILNLDQDDLYLRARAQNVGGLCGVCGVVWLGGLCGNWKDWTRKGRGWM